MEGSQRSGSGKAVLPPHALALYQQQITMAHGESSQEVKQHKQQQQQQLSGQPGKQQPYTPQADRDREALRSSSPRVRPRSPSAGDKDGTYTSVIQEHYFFNFQKTYLSAKVTPLRIPSICFISISLSVFPSHYFVLV